MSSVEPDQMEQKMDSVTEYMKRGGIVGVANKALMDEFLKAKGDTSHILYPVVMASKNEGDEAAARLLMDILWEVEESSPLYSMRIVMMMEMNRYLLKYAEENCDDEEKLVGIPQRIIMWAGMGVERRQSRTLAGLQKGKKCKEKVIGEWKKSGQTESAISFATKLFEKWGGRTDIEGNKEKQQRIPSPKTMAGYISKYKKNISTF